jgi:murein DD-endopeptidase MepM/ murein hydrolase activator NlpD
MARSALFKLCIMIVSLWLNTSCDTRINLSPIDNTAASSGGIYHGIWGRQNLWLIAEAYNKSVHDLAVANKLKTPFDLSIGDRIFIPGVKKHVDIKFKDPAWDISLKSMSWPLKGEIVCDWKCKDQDGLAGIVIAAPEGSLIRAARDGWVVYEGEDFMPYGRMIILQHGYVLASIYGCISKNLVKVGDRIDEGEPIAVIGRCIGYQRPTLHLEVVHYDKRINPRKAMDTGFEDIDAVESDAK